MNIKQAIQVVHNGITNWYDRVSGSTHERKMRYVRYGILAALVLLMLIGLLLGRHFFVSYREQNAQKALSMSLAESFNAQRTVQPDWSMVAVNCAHAAEDNSSSHLKPYFMALQADALIKAGNTEQALEVMDAMLARMPTHDPLVPLYALKGALMSLDAADTLVQERGLKVLEKLASDEANIYRDAAQFYLGHYYWTRDQLDKARAVWQELVAQRRVELGMRSPWADLASSKLSDQV